MSVIETGRVCIVTAGADRGQEVVIKETVDDNFVRIAGAKVKERRINVKHLEPTSRKAEVPIPQVKEKKPKMAVKKEAAAPKAEKDTKIVAKAIEKAMAENKGE